MMDQEDLEDLILAWIGGDLRSLYDEGVAMRWRGDPEPKLDDTGAARVRHLGWTRENERGWGGES